MLELTLPPAGKGFWARHRCTMLLSLGVAGAGYAAYHFYNAHQKKLVRLEQCAEEDEISLNQLQAHFEEVEEDEDEEEEEEGKEDEDDEEKEGKEDDDEEEDEDDDEEEEEQQVLPPLPEAGRDWKSYYYRNWDDILPPPTLQLSSSLPRIPRQPNKTKWSGVCSLHCYGETITALLRLACRQDVGFNVDYLALILSATGRGFLGETGASVYNISFLLAQSGIPFEASTIPTYFLPRGVVLKPHQRAYALGLSITYASAHTLPLMKEPWTQEAIAQGLHCDSTPDLFEKVIKFREQLCKIIDSGPIAVTLNPQRHYYDIRPEDEPYRLKANGEYTMIKLSSGKEAKAAHVVTVYGYACPGGDVRTLLLMYQENTIRAPAPNQDEAAVPPDQSQSPSTPDGSRCDLWLLHTGQLQEHFIYTGVAGS